MAKPKLSLVVAIGVRDKHKKSDKKKTEDYGKVIGPEGGLTNNASMYQKGTPFQVANSKLRKGEEDEEKMAKGGVISPKSGHNIKQLSHLKKEGWRNADTGTEMSAEEGERRLQELQQNKADKSLKQHLTDMYSTKKKSEPIGFAKGGKVEKERIFGDTGEPSPNTKSGKEHHAKQSEALSRLAEKRYGLPLTEAKGKFYSHERINKERAKDKLPPLSKQELAEHEDYEKSDPSSTSHGNTMYRAKEQKSNPKPDWHSGNLESQRHVGAKVHEMAHLDLEEKHKKLGDLQEKMAKGGVVDAIRTKMKGKK